LALLGSACVISLQADKVKFEQLPGDLRDKIRIYTGSNAIEDIDRDVKSGRTTYEVAFKDKGQNRELRFDDKGQLLNADGSPALDSRKISYNELPDAVRRMADTRLLGAQANDIDRVVRDGQVSYEIGFKNKDQQQQELVISQEGRILRDVNLAQGAAPAAGTVGVNKPAASAPANIVAKPVPLSASQKVDFANAPSAVQNAITTAARGARIEDLERGTWRGQTIYQAAFKDNDRNIELQVNENGSVIFDPRNSALGRPGAGATGRSSSVYPNVTSPVQLSASQKVQRTSVPPAVERAIQAHVGANAVEDIERGGWQGKTVYEVAFKDGGKHVELQLDENGNVVFDPRVK